MSAATDLWPDLGLSADRKLPALLLGQQAAQLGRKTRGMVLARVRSYSSGKAGFSHVLQLRVPDLGDYYYELLHVSHAILGYPATLRYMGTGVNEPVTRTANDEAEFVNALREFLGSEETRQVIQALLSQEPEEELEES